MAGRGRGAVLPAWMKDKDKNIDDRLSNNQNYNNIDKYVVPGQFEDSMGPNPANNYKEYDFKKKEIRNDNKIYNEKGNRSLERNRDKDKDKDKYRDISSRKDRDKGRDKDHERIRDKDRDRDRNRDRERDREKDGDRDRERDRDRDRERERERERERKKSSRRRSSRSRSRKRSSSGHSTRRRNSRERKEKTKDNEINSTKANARIKRERVKKFDVYPPGVTKDNAAAYAAQAILQQKLQALSGATGPASFGPPPNMASSLGIQPGATNAANAVNSATASIRHARRVYVGGIGLEVTEQQVLDFFNDVLDKALDISDENEKKKNVMSVYINHDRHFAFVEVKSAELAAACMDLDGIKFQGQPVKIRRPNDFNANLIPLKKPIPTLNLSKLGICSTNVTDGPEKIYFGGLPCNLNDEQVKELIEAFGVLKSFHLVKDQMTGMSKGYGFCEYLSAEITDTACKGLNGMNVGDKILTFRRANSPENLRAIGVGAALTLENGKSSFGGLGIDPSTAALQAISMAGIGLGAPLSPPSRVIVLKNMVIEEELEDQEEYEDILEDIRTECSRYGKVLSIIIPRTSDGYPKASVGKVYVEFIDIPSAEAASNELNGRGFANRTVSVEYMNELKYSSRNFA